MASNASTRESTAESTNDREIPIDTIEDTPKRARRAKSSKKSVGEKSGSQESVSDKKSRSSAKQAKKSKKAASGATNKTIRALSREELLELESVQKLIRSGRKKGSVDRKDLRLAFEDERLGSDGWCSDNEADGNDDRVCEFRFHGASE